MRLRNLLTAVALLAALQVMPAAAQEATPTVDAPSPELCTLDPLTPDELQRIADADITPEPTSTPITGNIELPDGQELFTSEREEVEKDLRRAIACVNTGEPLKALAAYTDEWIAGFLSEQGGLDDELVAGLQVDRDLQPDQYLQIVSLGDAARLGDGRVAIVVVGLDPQGSGEATPRLFVLAEVRPGRFLIDEVIPIEPA